MGAQSIKNGGKENEDDKNYDFKNNRDDSQK